ncbi:MAG: right-handed parallel beta-helix repeat-containing protein, partial [Candidatus Thorarchaeota archaeon]|nr:right-handed parallel beta-helix repeat-containing protein [Candidatus Thorarchaeota archaeon]
AIAQYQTSEPLVITSNVDFALLGATGVGTRSDPYKFESLEISDNGYCIQIQMTTAFFVISNCKLESSEFFPVILFDNVKNGRVEQCELTGGSNGLYLIQSQDSSIEENSFYDCWNGISLFSTSNSTFIDNRIHNNKNRGIIFDQSDYCFVLNNSIYSNFKHGIEILFDSHNNTIYGNSIGWNDVSGGYEVNAI